MVLKVTEEDICFSYLTFNGEDLIRLLYFRYLNIAISAAAPKYAISYVIDQIKQP